MATAVRISESLLKDARKFSKIDRRSLTGQIEHWAKIGKCAEENSDLTYDLIKEILGTKDAAIQKELIGQAFDLAKLSQNLLHGEELTNFIKRSYKMIK